MRVAIVIMALLAVSQMAAAGGYQSYAPAPAQKTYSVKGSYVKPKVETQLVTKTYQEPPTVVAVKGSPVLVQKTESCRPATLPVTAELVFKCSTGYTAVESAGKVTSCTKQVCSTPPPKYVEVEVEVDCPVTKPVYTKSKPMYAKSSKPSYATDKYGFQYHKASSDKYYKPVATKAKYAPKKTEVVVVPQKCTKKETVAVQQPEVCQTVSIAPVATCAGTISNGVCVIAYETATCPTGYTASNGLCTRTTTITQDGPIQYVTVPGKTKTVTEAVPVTTYKKVSYTTTKASYSGKGKYGFLGKLLGLKKDKYAPAPASYGTPAPASYSPAADTIPLCPAPTKSETTTTTTSPVVVAVPTPTMSATESNATSLANVTMANTIP